MNAMRQFECLWDGSAPGWVVVRHEEDRERLEVLFANGGPTVREMKALRSIVPSLSSKVASEAFDTLRGVARFDLGEHESALARRMKRMCKGLDLNVSSQACPFVRYSIVNEQTDRQWLVEDPEILMAVVEAAISRGVPMRHSTA